MDFTCNWNLCSILLVAQTTEKKLCRSTITTLTEGVEDISKAKVVNEYDEDTRSVVQTNGSHCIGLVDQSPHPWNTLSIIHWLWTLRPRVESQLGCDQPPSRFPFPYHCIHAEEKHRLLWSNSQLCQLHCCQNIQKYLETGKPSISECHYVPRSRCALPSILTPMRLCTRWAFS